MVTFELLQITLELWGAFFVVACGCTSLITVSISPRRDHYMARLLFLDAIWLLSDIIALAFRGIESIIGFYAVRISNFMVFVISPLMPMMFMLLIGEIIKSRDGTIKKSWKTLMYIFNTVHILLIIVSQFTGILYYFDEHNRYHRSQGYIVATVLGMLELILLGIIIVNCRRYFYAWKFRILIIYLLMPVVSVVIQTLYYGISLNNIAVTIALLLVFLSEQSDKNSALYRHKKKRLENEIAIKTQQLLLAQKEHELDEARNKILLFQMQPHFIFNALGSIEQLCHMDSKKAAEATHYFSKYLRNNVYALNKSTMIQFNEELSNIRSYIWLEQMRFGDALRFREDIQAIDFEVPILSVQSLILYSIKNGTMSYDGPYLYVLLSTKEEPDSYVITIQDNGTEIIYEISPEERYQNTIIARLKENLASMCNGTIEFDETANTGFLYTIRIPKKKEKAGI